MRRLTSVVLALLLALGVAAPAVADAGQQVLVALPSGRTVTLDADSSFTVERLKVDLEAEIGIASAAQVLAFARTVLADDRTLADYNIQYGATLQFRYAEAVRFTDDTLGPVEIDGALADGVRVNGLTATYALTAGALPDGIVLDAATGSLTGTPTTLGLFDVTVTATRDDGATIDRRFTGRVTGPFFATMQVFVRVPDGRALTVDTSSSDTVENLRTRLESLVGIAPAAQRLVFEGTELVDGLTLADYDIRDGDLVVLQTRAAVAAGPTLVAAGFDPSPMLLGAGFALVAGLALSRRRHA